jgi:hypothetical protein
VIDRWLLEGSALVRVAEASVADDSGHVALVFRLAPDERWRAWERVRLRWILAENEVA